jgi:hypothetical protein
MRYAVFGAFVAVSSADRQLGVRCWKETFMELVALYDTRGKHWERYTRRRHLHYTGFDFNGLFWSCGIYY